METKRLVLHFVLEVAVPAGQRAERPSVARARVGVRSEGMDRRFFRCLVGGGFPPRRLVSGFSSGPNSNLLALLRLDEAIPRVCVRSVRGGIRTRTNSCSERTRVSHLKMGARLGTNLLRQKAREALPLQAIFVFDEMTKREKLRQVSTAPHSAQVPFLFRTAARIPTAHPTKPTRRLASALSSFT